MALLNLIGPLAIRLIGTWLDKAKANAELRAAFESFKMSMQRNGLVPVQLRDQVDEATADLDRQDAERAKNTPSV